MKELKEAKHVPKFLHLLSPLLVSSLAFPFPMLHQSQSTNWWSDTSDNIMWNRSHLPYVNSNGKNNVDRYSFFRTQVDLSSCQVSYTNVLHIVNVFYSDNFYKNYSTADEKIDEKKIRLLHILRTIHQIKLIWDKAVKRSYAGTGSSVGLLAENTKKIRQKIHPQL